MKPRLESLAPVLDVRDVTEAAAYYRDKLGFEILFIAESPHLAPYAGVYRDGFLIHFLEQPSRDISDLRSGFNATVSDVDALYRELQQRGGLAAGFPRTFQSFREHPPEDKDYGMRDLSLVDPDGYILVFGHPVDGHEDLAD